MKKTSKIISLLLTLAMILTMAVPMTVSASFSDVPSDHHYYDAIQNLVAEGILDGMGDGTFGPEQPLTRAQFTKIICYALAVGNLTYSDSEKSIFTDVAPEHWAANNIVTAYNQGIINGMGDGTFAPESGVLYEQAVKMVVCALGYSTERAEAEGGYPEGYMNIAINIKLLKGINDARMGQVMTRGAVAQLIDNMRDANLVSEEGPGGSLREETTTSRKYEGKLIAGCSVDITGNYTENTFLKNQIEVKNGSTSKIFDVSEIKNFDINDFIGRTVVVYYEEETGVTTDVATSVALLSKRNQETKITFDSIYDYGTDFIEYYTDSESNETEKISYLPTSNIILNGEYTGSLLNELIEENRTNSGYLLLVNTTSNNTADLVFVKTYETWIVGYVNRSESKVYDKYDNTKNIVLDTSDRNKKITMTLNGSPCTLTAISENAVISISKSESEKYIEVLVSTTKVKGTIKSTSGSPVQITLDSSSTRYTLDSNVYIDGGYSTTDVVPGKYVTITLNTFGKVARVEFTAEATYNYGYISRVIFGTIYEPGVRAILYKPKVLNSTVEGQDYEFADRVKINGTNYKVEDDMIAIEALLNASADALNPALTGTDTPSNEDYSQPVRYTLDAAGRINAIVTNSTTEGNNATTLYIKDLTAAGLTSSDSIMCTYDGTNFGSSYRISSSTPVLYIPADRTGGTYSSKSNTFFKKDTEYYVQFANVSTTGVVGCVYLYGIDGGIVADSAAITEDTTPMIVKEIVQSEHETRKDEFYNLITLTDITTGEVVKCYDKDSALTLKVGDVVRVAIDDEKFVREVKLIADASAVKAGTFNYTGDFVYTDDEDSSDRGTVGAKFRSVLGLVSVKDNYDITFVQGYDATGTNTESYTASASTIVYIVDTQAMTDANKVQAASVLDVEVSSKVLVYTSENSLKAIVVFK